ncbi:MAG: DUF2628 domain-containing protein [Gemmatimonadaceae bacterium]|jgi:hypothetical protein|nr:DUF2628 domain-containing protein [Gemmatimonadaceae bacterium]MCC6432590.1 DUF2628 domain-containing protein [Gemmatimonadaceae bacterium]
MSDPMRPDDASTNGSANNAGSGPVNGAPDPQLPAWFKRQSSKADPLTDERLAAFLGPQWETYRRKFTPFREDPSFVPTWNWSAAFFVSAWFLYRKLYLAAFGFMLLPGMIFRMLTGSDTNLTLTELQKPENQGLLIMQLAVGISSAIAAGGIANWLLFRRAQAAVRLSAMQEMPESETIPWLTRVGGINRLGVALAVMVFLVTSYAAVRA